MNDPETQTMQKMAELLMPLPLCQSERILTYFVEVHNARVKHYKVTASKLDEVRPPDAAPKE